jgi:Domain of unknown function (DUF4349)
MPRKISIALFAILLLAGCTRRGTEPVVLNAETPPAPDIAVADAASTPAQIFSFRHTLSLIMAHDAVRARFVRARERCLHDAALHCRLVDASENESGDAVSAHLEVALPHDAIAGFEAGLLKPLGEDKGGVEVGARSTQTQSVESQANDIDRKVAQLTKYRDGLAELAKRPNLNVGDFIRVQQELSQTEASLDEALAQKRDIDGRIARESLIVDLTQRVTPVAPVSPIAQVWRDAAGTLVESTAEMLRFVIQIVPWLPVLIGMFFLLRWLFRIARRRSAIAQSAPAKTGG